MQSSSPPPRASRPSIPFPTDYSICPICNLDHKHDVPRLDATERARIFHLHMDDHPVPPYDLIVSTR